MNKKNLAIEIYGSETLRKPSEVVTKFDRKLEKFCNNMLKTMYANNGVGLAAPQIGLNQRIIVIDTLWANERYSEANKKEDNYDPHIMINPIIVYKEGEIDSYEGCLSFPGVFFNIKRAKKIVFKYQDLTGREIRQEAQDNLFCRCIQHEIDHLDGKLFVDLMKDKAIAQEELSKHGLGEIKSTPHFVL